MIRKPRPILRYHGGKWMLAPWIISHFPAHRIYIEPFGGAASVLIRKDRSYAEIYNELDQEIVNVFKVIRENGKELQALLLNTPFARQEFTAAHEHSDDPLDRARRTIIKSFMGFGSDAIKNKSGFRSNSHRSGNTPAHDWANYASALPFLIDRLRGVVIESRNAFDLIPQHDHEDALFYVDPPYVHSTRSAKKPTQYHFEMTDADHRKLATLLHAVRGKVVLSGYECPLYEELYGDWKSETKDALADGARPRVEKLWFNFIPHEK